MVHDVGILIGLLLHRLIYYHKSCSKVVQSKFPIQKMYLSKKSCLLNF